MIKLKSQNGEAEELQVRESCVAASEPYFVHLQKRTNTNSNSLYLTRVDFVLHGVAKRIRSAGSVLSVVMDYITAQ